MKKLAPPLPTTLTALAVALSIAVTLGLSGRPAHAARPQQPVNALSNQALIDALDETDASNSDRTAQIAHLLWSRRNQIPRRDLVSMIADPTRSRESRELMVDLLAGPPEEARATDDVRDLLKDRWLDPKLKARLVATCEFDREDSVLLQSLAAGPEDAVAFQALKRLGKADPEAARDLALAAITEPSHQSDSKLSASYKLLVRSGVAKSDRGVRAALLAHLARVLGDPGSDEKLRDSATFALADMRSLDALRTLLEAPAADRILCVGAVEQNASLIKQSLEQDPDEPTVELAVMAMELCPVSEVADPLSAARSRVTSRALRERIDTVLESIATHGVPMNPKWTEE